MTNVTRRSSAPPPPNPNSMLQTVTGFVRVPIGTPVTKLNGNVQPAFADVEAHTRVTGLLSTPGSQGGLAHVQFAGPITLTEEQWAEVITNADNTHVLIPDTNYYLSADAAGQLTNEPPATGGQFVAPLGRALDGTCFLIQISSAIEVP